MEQDKQKEEVKISMYDPSIDAYREISLEAAKKFVESAKEVEQQIKELEQVWQNQN
jgi:hypothetical protein